VLQLAAWLTYIVVVLTIFLRPMKAPAKPDPSPQPLPEPERSTT
jgi:high-affinity iron transporter